MNIEIRKLEKRDNRSNFSSGDIEIDRFFIKFAGQNQFKHKIGVTYVALDKESQNILGYITVLVSSLNIENMNVKEFDKFPKYPLPIIRIARFGVDKRYQKLGIGRKLLQKTFYLALEIEDLAGCLGIFLDAKRDAITFYEKYDFEIAPLLKGELKIKPTQTVMYISNKTLRKTLK